MVKHLHADDRKTRRLAFVIITTVFLVSVAALLYWAINVAAAKMSSRITTHSYNHNPINSFIDNEIVLFNKTAKLNNYVMI